MNIFESLLTGCQPSGVSPELLETLGKQAASRFVEDGTDLNETIAKLASEHPQLENEHIKRVVEFANNEAFQHLFKHSNDKNVHFPVADPGVIIRDLKDGGSPAHDGKVLNPENKEKTASLRFGDSSSDYLRDPVAVQDFGSLQEAFADFKPRDEQMAKMAGVQTETVQGGGHANPVDDIYDEHLKLQAMEAKLAEAHETFDMMLQAAQEDFFKLAKREVLGHDGADMVQVIQAVKMAAPSDRLALAILKPVTERLVKEGALTTKDLEKRASVSVLNPAHPLVASVAGIVKAAQEKVNAAAALVDVRAGLVHTGSFLRDRVG